MADFFATAILLIQAFILFTISTIGKHLMSTQETIDAITTQLGKAKDEIVAQIVDLNNQITAAGVTEQVDTTALTAAAQALDDIVPDAG